jgi:CRP-like cAMP-binding protein
MDRLMRREKSTPRYAGKSATATGRTPSQRQHSHEDKQRVDPATLDKVPALHDLSGSDRLLLAQAATRRRTYAKGSALVQEGEHSDALLVIERGSVEVVKRELVDDEENQLSLGFLEQGDLVGEMALLVSGPRSATAIARSAVVAIELPLDRLRTLVGAGAAVGTRLLGAVAKQVVTRLRAQNQHYADGLQRELMYMRTRAETENLLSKIIGTTCLYVLSLGLMRSLIARGIPTTVVGLPMMLAFAGSIFVLLKTSPYPLRAFGFTLQNWRGVLRSALGWTVLVALAIAGVKFLLIRTVPGASDLEVFELTRHSRLSPTVLLVMGCIYAVFAPVQEIARAGVQCAMQRAMEGRRAMPILLTNLIFSVTHVHLSLAMAVAVFPLGLFWGWLLARQRSVLGPCLSHVFIGVYGFYVVGFDRFLL